MAPSPITRFKGANGSVRKVGMPWADPSRIALWKSHPESPTPDDVPPGEGDSGEKDCFWPDPREQGAFSQEPQAVLIAPYTCAWIGHLYRGQLAFVLILQTLADGRWGGTGLPGSVGLPLPSGGPCPRSGCGSSLSLLFILRLLRPICIW